MSGIFTKLENLTDDALAGILAADGRGRTPVYAAPIREALGALNGQKSVTLVAEWAAVNKDAAESKQVKDGNKTARDVVLAGLKAAVNNDKTAKGRIAVHRHIDADKLVLVVTQK